SIVDLPNDAPRARTAQAAVALVDEVHRRPDQAIDVLARLEIPTSAAALGTSIKQSQSIVDALRMLNLDLIRQAVTLGGEYAADAERLKARMLESAVADELTTSLRARLGEAQDAATDLLGRAARQAAPAPAPEPDLPDVPAERQVAVRNQVEGELD